MHDLAGGWRQLDLDAERLSQGTGTVSGIVKIRVLARFPMQCQMVCLFASQAHTQASYHPAMYATCINVHALSLTDAGTHSQPLTSARVRACSQTVLHAPGGQNPWRQPHCRQGRPPAQQTPPRPARTHQPPTQITSISIPSPPCWGALALCLCCFAHLDGM